MPESLSTFLLTTPYKNVGYLRHVCDQLQIPSDGIATELRQRILKHVGKDDELEKKVRKIARNLERKKTTPPAPLTPKVHVLRGSSPARVRLPPQVRIGDGICESEDELEKSIIEKLDEAEVMYDKLAKGRKTAGEK